LEESEEEQRKDLLKGIKELKRELEDFEKGPRRKGTGNPLNRATKKKTSERKTNSQDKVLVGGHGPTPLSSDHLPPTNKTQSKRRGYLNGRILRIGRMMVKGRPNARQISIDVVVRDPTNGLYHKAKALVDSGCEGVAMDRKWAHENGLNLQKIKIPIRMLNADGTESKSGKATHYFKGRMKTGDHVETFDAVITDLEKEHPIFLGMTWLKRHNPEVDWEKAIVNFSRCPEECDFRVRNITQDKEGPTPDYLKECPKAFNASTHVELAEHRNFDFEIKLTDDKPVTSKIYPLTRDEKEQLKKWLDEGVKIGQYKPSKSPYASPMFFKHEPTQLRPLIDYRQLNAKTVKDKFVSSLDSLAP
jgi:predicted aspartyl protease